MNKNKIMPYTIAFILNIVSVIITIRTYEPYVIDGTPILIAIGVSILEYNYLVRYTDLPSRFILKVTVGTAISPISTELITRLFLEKESNILPYLIYLILGLIGFFIGDMRVGQKAIEKHEIKRKAKREMRVLRKS